jgi:hypothetical protein
VFKIYPEIDVALSVSLGVLHLKDVERFNVCELYGWDLGVRCIGMWI